VYFVEGFADKAKAGTKEEIDARVGLGYRLLKAG
jgi:hypothetical protein